jgi:hypothetical protein
MLSQQSPVDDKWHPIAYYSKSLSVMERNYEIHDKEMLAIIRALEDWRHFLEGVVTVSFAHFTCRRDTATGASD